MVRRRKEQWHQQKGYMFCFRNRGRREKRQNVNLGPSSGKGVLHFIGHQFLLVSHTIGEHVLVLIQAFYSIGFKMDAAGNVLDVLHVCPRGRRRDDETVYASSMWETEPNTA